MKPVVTPDEMARIDEAATEPVEVLIGRAGAQVARVAIRLLGGTYGRVVNVIAGPGNNGADGRVAAERLLERGVSVRVFDALDCPDRLPPADLVIDAAFGSGFRDDWARPDVGDTAVLAVDVPTGLDAATGRAARATWRATATVTFCAARPGHLLGDGPGVVGELTVADIGLAAGSPPVGVVEAVDVADWLPDRSADAHKWAAAVRVVAGSPGMTGAAHLATAAAMRAGSGMVVVSSPGTESEVPVEVVQHRAPASDWADDVLADLDRFHALVIGPGLGRDEDSIPSMLQLVVEAVVPTVIDGDGLFALSWNEAGDPGFLRDRDVPTVLTPHDGEYGRLMGHPPGDDRIGAAQELADATGATVLLKGPTTVVAGTDGHTWLVTNGTQRLATAGTGDVLAGIVAAFLARGMEPAKAGAAGAWVHAEAARLGHGSLVAGDLVDLLPLVLAGLPRTA